MSAAPEKERPAGGGGRRATTLAAALALALAAVPAPLGAQQAPGRVVSINLCTDQLAMALAKPGQIVSVSRLARDPELSDMSEQADRLPVNNGQAEEIVPLRPDLVLAGRYTARATVALLRRLGWRVEEFAPARSFADIRADIERMGALLGRQQRASELVDAFDARLAALRKALPPGRTPLAALYHAGDRTEGRGTLADDILAAAGWRNLAADLGIDGGGALPLEVLVANRPDVVLVGDAEASWSTAATPNVRHPALIMAIGGGDRLSVLPDRATICGTPSVVEAVRQLADARRRLIAAWGDGR